MIFLEFAYIKLLVCHLFFSKKDKLQTSLTISMYLLFIFCIKLRKSQLGKLEKHNTLKENIGLNFMTSCTNNPLILSLFYSSFLYGLGRKIVWLLTPHSVDDRRSNLEESVSQFFWVHGSLFSRIIKIDSITVSIRLNVYLSATIDLFGNGWGYWLFGENMWSVNRLTYNK